MNKKILVIEDDAETLEFVCKGFRDHHHFVVGANTGDQGLEYAREQQFDFMVIDRLLPNIEDGLEIVNILRQEKNNTPILILSAIADEPSRTKALNVGCDDYLCKPFSFDELYARFNAILRRCETNAHQTELCVGDLRFDTQRAVVQRGNQRIRALSPTELQLLKFLMSNSPNVVTREMIARELWDYDFVPNSGVIDVHICRLRKHIDHGHDFRLIQTVFGKGYKLCAPSA